MSYHHLTPYERARLDILYKQGYRMCTIALKLFRSPSTISRELRRFSGQRYEVEIAQQQYMKRRKHVGRKGKISTELVDLIEDKLMAFLFTLQIPTVPGNEEPMRTVMVY